MAPALHVFVKITIEFFFSNNHFLPRHGAPTPDVRSHVWIDPKGGASFLPQAVGSQRQNSALLCPSSLMGLNAHLVSCDVQSLHAPRPRAPCQVPTGTRICGCEIFQQHSHISNCLLYGVICNLSSKRLATICSNCQLSSSCQLRKNLMRSEARSRYRLLFVI